MRKIGVSVVIDTGEIQFHYGLTKTIKKFNVLDQFSNLDKNAKLIQVYKLKIYIDNI